MVVYSREFKLYSDNGSIMPCQLVIEWRALDCVCVFSTLVDFWQVETWRILRSNVFASNSVSNWKKFYRDFSDVATGLWRRLFEPYAMSWVVPAFQIGQNVHCRTHQIWTAFHDNGWQSRSESPCLDLSKKSPNSLWSCRRSMNL
jgi:hypothetical protein